MGVLKSSGKNAGGFSGPPDNSHRPRCRQLGVAPGVYPAGELDAITDVPGVTVGHCTLWRGEGPLEIGRGPVRTGVTAILPHQGNTIKNPVEAACCVFNGAGTATGLSCLEEYGILETPILLTNTLSVGEVYDATVRFVVENFIDGPDDRGWFAPLVGETYDGFLNDIHGLHVGSEHVNEALRRARPGPVAEGAVGAGAGIRTCGFKAGIGTASRRVRLEGREFTVGVLVQSNFPGSLIVAGVPVGEELGVAAPEPGAEGNDNAGSIMAVIATDLPLDSRQLKRLAARSALGMARAGALGAHGSGDFFISFSTTRRSPSYEETKGLFFRPESLKAENYLDPAFAAAAEATEEAILNSIFKAVTVTGRDGNTVEELNLEKTRRLLKKYSRLK